MRCWGALNSGLRKLGALQHQQPNRKRMFDVLNLDFSAILDADQVV
jgi:hypothetical protein